MLLLFGSIWLFPLITALVAGDIVAAEDRNGTLKTILTRSVERQQIFAGKALAAVTYAIAAIAISGGVALVAGILASGFNPLITLSGTRSRRRTASRWSARACSSTCCRSSRSPASALLLSTVFRNSAPRSSAR